MAYEAELRFAMDAVKAACRVCEAVQATLMSEESMAKKDKSPVTVADFGAQAVVARKLEQAFPGDPLVAEEDSAELRDPANAGLRARVVEQVARVIPGMGEAEVSAAIDRGSFEGGGGGRYWTLDPIDGTKGFLRKEQYAVALALIEGGRVVLGVLGCPNLPVDAKRESGPRGCLFGAVRGGGGSFMVPMGGGGSGGEKKAVRVTSIADPRQANFCESVESGHSDQDDSAMIAKALGITAAPARMDSQCKYAAVARGDASIYLRLPTKKGYEEKIWDHAAGAIVIEEAGGKVTDVRGAALDFSLGRTLKNNLGVVVTNGKLHEAVIAAVKQTLGAKT